MGFPIRLPILVHKIMMLFDIYDTVTLMNYSIIINIRIGFEKQWWEVEEIRKWKKSLELTP